MPKAHHPRRGSMQFWPRKRSRHSLVRVRSWASEGKAKPLGFVGFKVGMTHVQANDTRAKSITKGEKIVIPTTLVECPAMFVVAGVFYKQTSAGLRKISTILAQKLPKEATKRIQMPKKQGKKLEDVTEFDDVRLLVQSQPHLTGVGARKPHLMEVALGGSKDDKLAYLKENLGKEIQVQDVFDEGHYIDIHGVTKGKGFQGTVKRYGVPIRPRKSEKTKRGIGNLGAWTPKRVDYRVAQPGKMGFHLRTEYNKLLLKLEKNHESHAPAGGLHKYGVLKNPFLLLKGSISGPRRRSVLLTRAIRQDKKAPKEFPEVIHIA